MPKYYVRVRSNKVISFSQRPIKKLRDNEIILETNELPSNDPLLMEYKNGKIVLKEEADFIKEQLRNHGIYRRKIETFEQIKENLKDNGDLPFHLIGRCILKLMELMRKCDSLLGDQFFVVRVLFDYSDPISYVSELDIEKELKEEIIEALKDFLNLKTIIEELQIVQ